MTKNDLERLLSIGAGGSIIPTGFYNQNRCASTVQHFFPITDFSVNKAAHSYQNARNSRKRPNFSDN
jgi:hypothetical protein